jgi:hypothetical protein
MSRIRTGDSPAITIKCFTGLELQGTQTVNGLIRWLQISGAETAYGGGDRENDSMAS